MEGDRNMIKKEWLRRAVRTFGQTFAGVLVTELAAGVDITDAKGILTIVIAPAIAAGISAVMNMERGNQDA